MIRRAIHSAGVTAVICALTAPWFSRVAPAARAEPAPFYSVRGWGEASGELTPVNAAARTLDGYLYFGTAAGLFRFNGHGFKRYDLFEVRKRQMRLHVTCLLADNAGGLWIGSRDEGLFYLHNGQFTAFGAEQGLTNDRLICLFQDSSGALWAGTDGGGAFRRTASGFEAVQLANHKSPLHPTAFAEDRSGRIWMGTHADGLLALRSNTVETVLGPLPRVTALLADDEGTVWAGAVSGLARVQNDALEQVPVLQPGGDRITRATVTSLAHDRHGNLWVGTSQGLVRLLDHEQELFGASDGLGDGFVQSLLADPEGSIWVGTPIGNLHQLHFQQVRLIAPFPGAVQRVFAMALANNKLWLGGSHGLAAVEYGHPAAPPDWPDLAGRSIFALGQDSQGRLWFSGRRGDWGFIDGPDVTPVAVRAPGGLLREANLFLRTQSGAFWAGTHAGLFEIGADGYRGELRTRLSHSMVFSACEDASGALWVGTGHGLNRVQEGEVEAFTNINGRPVQVVLALHAEADGTVWIGTDRGLWRFRNGQFFAFLGEHGAPPVIGQLVEDNAGDLWCAAGGLIVRFSKASLHDVAEGRASKVRLRAFGRNDGLRATVASGRGLAAKTPEGLLCFATDKGVAIVHPHDLPPNDVAPPVLIEEVLINGVTHDWSEVAPDDSRLGEVVLPPGYNRLEIHYAGLTYATPERTQFSFRVKGLSDAWENVGAQRTAFLRALPVGEYEFQVIAANGSLVTSPTPARLRIVALAPWWQTTQFKAGTAVAGLALLAGLYSLRVQRLKQLNQARREFSKRLLEDQENERHRLAKELHDGLGQDLLIIKNQVAMLERELPPDQLALRDRAQQITSVSQAAINDARSIAYNLRPADLDRAGLTASFQTMIDRAAASSAIAFDCDVQDIDDLLPKDQEVVLYRIAQELVNNILKHSRARRAIVDLQRTTDAIELTVSDNGQGFDVEAVIARAGAARGLGLDSLTERVEMLQGSLELESKPGQGTRFRIRIPVGPAAVGIR